MTGKAMLHLGLPTPALVPLSEALIETMVHPAEG